MCEEGGQGEVILLRPFDELRTTEDKQSDKRYSDTGGQGRGVGRIRLSGEGARPLGNGESQVFRSTGRMGDRWEKRVYGTLPAFCASEKAILAPFLRLTRFRSGFGIDLYRRLVTMKVAVVGRGGGWALSGGRLEDGRAKVDTAA